MTLYNNDHIIQIQKLNLFLIRLYSSLLFNLLIISSKYHFTFPSPNAIVLHHIYYLAPGL